MDNDRHYEINRRVFNGKHQLFRHYCQSLEKVIQHGNDLSEMTKANDKQLGDVRARLQELRKEMDRLLKNFDMDHMFCTECNHRWANFMDYLCPACGSFNINFKEKSFDQEKKETEAQDQNSDTHPTTEGSILATPATGVDTYAANPSPEDVKDARDSAAEKPQPDGGRSGPIRPGPGR